HPPAVPLKTEESAKKANRLSRRHSCASKSRRITSTDDNLCFRHTYRPDELVESGCVWKGETNAPMRYCGAKARMVRTMNAVTASGEKDRVRHTSVVPLPRIMHRLHAKRSVGTCRS